MNSVSEQLEYAANRLRNGWPVCPVCNGLISFTDSVRMIRFSDGMGYIHNFHDRAKGVPRTEIPAGGERS